MKISVLISIYTIVLIQLAKAQSPIIPTPVTYVFVDGKIDLTEQISLKTANLSEKLKNYLIDELQNSFAISTQTDSLKGLIEFKKIANTPKDFYSINIAEKITITYTSEASCFYAINSFLQLFQFEEDHYVIQKAFLQDFPNFQWRGLHLDVSRHFFGVDEVKRYIDLMSLYKFNVLHWHLTDDQGWRIEIKKYPKLTEIGAFRDSTLIGHYNDFPHKFEKKKVGGFYTQEEIKEIVQYAQDRFITVVPEIEMPGHARAALAAYPEYSCTGKQLPVASEWGVFDEIFCSKPETIDFLKDILEEVLTLFPSEYIHIGGDEAPKTNWKTCPNCQKNISENQLKDEHHLQSFFIQQIDNYLFSKGRKMIGWDEILEGGLSTNAAVMSWRGEAGGIEAAKLKHDVVMTPTEFCYFDYYQSSHPAEPVAIGGYLPLEKVYQFNPISASLSNEERSYILGGQANLWTEYISEIEAVEYMMYPRALAMAQVLWCKEKPTFEVFEKTLIDYQIGYLKRHGVVFSKAMFYPTMEISSSEKGLKVHFKGSVGNDKFNVLQNINGLASEKDQILGKSDTLFFDRNSSVQNIHFEISPAETYEFEYTPFDLKIHSAVGLPIKLLTQPNSKYSNLGALSLVDGVRGHRPWKGNEWLGFDIDTISWIVDLKKNAQIESFDLGFLDAKGSWIYLPESIQLFVSGDQKKWNALPKEIPVENFHQEVKKTGRFVKIVIIAKNQILSGLPGEGFHPWTFVDEVELNFK
jgi:hexosaminidase